MFSSSSASRSSGESPLTFAGGRFEGHGALGFVPVSPAQAEQIADPVEHAAEPGGLGGVEAGCELALEDGEFKLMDSQKNVVTASKRLVSRVTICRGRRMGG